MLQKLSRLDKLEIILIITLLFSIMGIIDNSKAVLASGIILAACLVSIVWIEIHREKSKKI